MLNVLVLIIQVKC